MSKSQAEGFKKTLRNMLRGNPATNKDVAERRKSPVERRADKLAKDLGMTDPNADFGKKRKRKPGK